MFPQLLCQSLEKYIMHDYNYLRELDPRKVVNTDNFPRKLSDYYQHKMPVALTTSGGSYPKQITVVHYNILHTILYDVHVSHKTLFRLKPDKIKTNNTLA